MDVVQKQNLLLSEGNRRGRFISRIFFFVAEESCRRISGYSDAVGTPICMAGMLAMA